MVVKLPKIKLKAAIMKYVGVLFTEASKITKIAVKSCLSFRAYLCNTYSYLQVRT